MAENRTPRSKTKILQLFVSMALACVIFPVIGNFFIVWATQRGWYKDPAATVRAMLSFVAQPWFPCLGGTIFGLFIGVWLDTFLRKKEREPLIKQVALDLSGLADEAERTASSLFEIIADHSTRPPTHPTFEADMPAAVRPELPPGRLWQQFNHDAREAAMRSYNTKYAATCWRIISTAKKYIAVDQSQEWHLTHMSDADGIESMGRFLSDIAANIRLIAVETAND